MKTVLSPLWNVGCRGLQCPWQWAEDAISSLWCLWRLEASAAIFLPFPEQILLCFCSFVSLCPYSKSRVEASDWSRPGFMPFLQWRLERSLLTFQLLWWEVDAVSHQDSQDEISAVIGRTFRYLAAKMKHSKQTKKLPAIIVHHACRLYFISWEQSFRKHFF